MNEARIEVDVDVESVDYRRALIWYHRTSFIIGTIAIVFFFIVGISGPIAFLISEKSKIPLANLPFGFVPFLAVSMFSAFRYYGIWKQSKALAEATEPSRFTFDELGVLAVSSSSSAQAIWDKYTKVCETNTDFIFFPMKIRFFPFPKRFFRKPEDILALRQLLSEKLGEKAKLLAN